MPQDNPQSDHDIIPGLPPELALDCLARLPYTAHRAASAVCARWRRLLRTPSFYDYRRRQGYLRRIACLVQMSTAAVCGGAGFKTAEGSPKYQLSMFEPETGSWDVLPPPPEYTDGIPLFCHVSGWSGRLVLIGGWNPVSYQPLREVFVYDFAAAVWRRGEDMPAARSFFAGGCVGGKVYVAGGHDGEKNALRSAMAYDVEEGRWEEVAAMAEERDECEGVVDGGEMVVEGGEMVVEGGEMVVVGGYGTETQGGFKGSAEVYDPARRRWRRVEGVWEEGRCPRGAVGWRRRRWEEWLGAAARVGTAAGVAVGETTAVVAGSEYEGGATGFYVVEKVSGRVRKVEGVGGAFVGAVQSGCCVEI